MDQTAQLRSVPDKTFCRDGPSEDLNEATTRNLLLGSNLAVRSWGDFAAYEILLECFGWRQNARLRVFPGVYQRGTSLAETQTR